MSLVFHSVPTIAPGVPSVPNPPFRTVTAVVPSHSTVAGPVVTGWPAPSMSPDCCPSATASQAATQVEAWRQLAGQWQSDGTEDEVAALYAARTDGRKVDL